ncbi:dynein light chain 1, cytoplasmic [Mycotypha africana]|uniref:dynein light chain 1, cytoplasmic n=1 Tax=Mycotypha africana TaxID=64632 RepID=UPI0023013286|nr:dynein light chain 1, cytoplasmic [Mycotypha africana]KAI8975259.1 dynein light chain 1, cytoplasmic [Mycotypha africana]
MADPKAVIKAVDMSEEMQQEAIECSTQALEKYNIEKDIAAHIKREFDRKYGPTWHCVVGRNFGSFVTHENIYAILQVMVVVAFGCILAKLGYFSNDKQKWLSKLNMIFFTPCLLFSNIASIISFEKLLAFWPIPCFYLIYAILNYISSQTVSRLAGLSPAYRRFVMACVMFTNSNSLPIAVISSLAVSEAVDILRWGPNDTSETIAARGISYTLFFAIFGNLIRWSYGYQLLQRHHDDDVLTIRNDEEEPIQHLSSTYQSFNQHPDHPSSGASSTASSEEYLSSDLVHRDGLPPRQPSSVTITVAADESTKHELSLLRILIRKIHGFMSPPLYAASLALIVGLSPLKPILYDKQSFLYPSFTKAIESCGKAAVPLILSCLGAQLVAISESQKPASPEMKRPVAIAIAVRMALMPFLVLPTVILFVLYGSAWSTLASDPVFITMMIVLGCTPTAINLVQITQVNNIFEEEMLRMLFWSYGVFCVPLCTFTVFLALNIVDRML